MEICYQKKKQVIYTEVCPEVKLRALASSPETKLLTDCCRLALLYAEEDPATMPDWFLKRFMKFCKDMTKEKGQTFQKKTNQQKLLLFADYEKGEHPFINFCARGYDDSEIKEKKTGKMKKGPWRKQKCVHLSGLVAIDIDHVEDPKAIFDRWQKEVDFKALKIYLIYITPKGKGLRVVFRCELSRGNLIENQMWMCEKLGVEPDDSCKDASRGYFLTSTENFLYDDLKQMYADEADEEFIQKYEPEYRAGNSSSTQTGSKANQPAGQGVKAVGQVDVQSVGDPLKWRGYDIQAIIDAWSAGHFGNSDKEVSRHAASLSLAKDLYIMFDRDSARTLALLKAQKWVQQIIEERDEDVERTVSDAANYVAEAESQAAKKGKNWLPQPSKEMQEAVAKVAGKDYKEVVNPMAPKRGMDEDVMLQKLIAWGTEIEALFPHFPLLKDVCAGLKKGQYPAALFVAGGTAMTLMTRCWYRFYHRPQQERRLNCSLFIIGHPASNKSMADDIYKILSAPIAAADKAGKAALNRYKQDMKKKAANKEGKDKPQVTIRIHPARTSNGQLIQDMLNARETIEGKEIQLHMLTFDTELDNSITLQQGGSWINKQSMELKAFHNEEDGQMYQNSDSPVDEFNVTWNFIYTGTPIALKKKVTPQNFGSGLSTRLAVIPMPKTNFEMMAFEEQTSIDWQRLERMKEWAYKLNSRFGELPLWPLVKHLYEWTANRMADCAEDESEANELMLKRVPYHALNYSAPFIDMRHWDALHQQGDYWAGTYEVDEIDWRLCELIARIQYATQEHFFGVLAEKYFDDMNSDVQFTGKRHQKKSVQGFNMLPEFFTREDVMRCYGYDKENTADQKISRLKKNQLIVIVTSGEHKGKLRKKQKAIL